MINIQIFHGKMTTSFTVSRTSTIYLKADINQPAYILNIYVIYLTVMQKVSQIILYCTG